MVTSCSVSSSGISSFFFEGLRTTGTSSRDFSLVSFLREDFLFGFNLTSTSSEGSSSSFTTVSTFSIDNSSADTSFFIDGFLLATEVSSGDFSLVSFLREDFRFGFNFTPTSSEGSSSSFTTVSTFSIVRFLHQPYQISPELLRAFLLFLLFYFLLLRTTEASSGDFSLVSFLREDFRFGFNFTSISSEGCSSFTTVSTFSIVNSAAGPSFFIDGFLLEKIFVLVLILLQPPLKAVFLLESFELFQLSDFYIYDFRNLLSFFWCYFHVGSSGIFSVFFGCLRTTSGDFCISIISIKGSNSSD
ncbi:hypothetical protein AGLY_012822 [Aphis glycines]|uniref:Uncharacterized protein n=1 Tax=Aphis glycines TaxID=307491 RepID=A0A6G0TAD9_APHGL|nr:hypothetical protein AGLY_012822 [Aphis glycines]